MATILHSVLTGAENHEPLGADTAANGEVYISNGLGSGAWATPPGVGNKIKVVNTEADFPTPSAGSITLDAFTEYRIGDSFSMTNKIIMSEGSSLTGDHIFGKLLTYNGTGNFITATDVNCAVHDIHFTCPNATAISLTDTVGGVFGFNLYQVQIDACVQIMAIDDYLTVVINQSNCRSSTLGLVFTGSNIALLSIQEFAIFSASATIKGVDLGSAVIGALEITNLFHSSTVAGAIGISGLASSGNIGAGGVATVRDSEFLGSITGLQTIVPNDLQWQFENNVGIVDTVKSCTGYILGNATATTIATVSTPVKANFGTGWITDKQNQFTSDNTGTHTFNGIDGTFKISGSIYADNAAGTNVSFRWYIAKNGTVLTSSVSERQYDTGNPGSTSVFAIVDLVATDTIELWVENITNATNITCITHNITIG
jgi:hypothetical protein